MFQDQGTNHAIFHADLIQQSNVASFAAISQMSSLPWDRFSCDIENYNCVAATMKVFIDL